ncbi:MAG: hypothetical protein AMXMBFR64_22990 [Myxococcales bacterium]
MVVLARLIDLYSLVLFASVILSWLPLGVDNPFVRVIRAVTEPVLAPVRRILPSTGGLDFSPIVVLVLLQLLRGVLLR